MAGWLPTADIEPGLLLPRAPCWGGCGLQPTKPLLEPGEAEALDFHHTNLLFLQLLSGFASQEFSGNVWGETTDPRSLTPRNQSNVYLCDKILGFVTVDTRLPELKQGLTL